MALPAVLSHEDLVKFRTRFCERFLQYGECNFREKCQYSHNMLWRRRSPSKHNYEPVLCEHVIIWTSSVTGKRQVSINCHSGKTCRFAHSREEILFHPSVYKTFMCETPSCPRFYCAFAHHLSELHPASDGLDYARRCIASILPPDVSPPSGSLWGGAPAWGASPGPYGSAPQTDLFTDESSDGDSLCGGEAALNESAAFDQGGYYHRPARKSSIASSNAPMLMAPRLSFNNGDWSDAASGLSANSWVTVTPSLRVETVVRAHSPVVPSELCRAVLTKDANGQAGNNHHGHGHHGRNKNGGSGGSGGSTQALAKVMQVEEGQDACYVAMLNELQSLCRSEHKALLSIKKVHAGRNANGSVVLCLAFEQCSTSLFQLVVDGYRGFSVDGRVKSVARRLNPHTGQLTATAVAKMGELLAALQRLHYIGVVHLRICPTNVLIDNEAGFKLADFLGKYRLMYCLEREFRSDYALGYLNDAAIVWLAPELSSALRSSMTLGSTLPLLATGSSSAHGSSSGSSSGLSSSSLKKADMYSLGLTLFFALTGQHMFGSFSDEERLGAAGALGLTQSGEQLFAEGVEGVVENMETGVAVNMKLLFNVPLALDLVLRMVATSPSERLDANELSRHPLFFEAGVLVNFIATLPATGAVFKTFTEYPVEVELGGGLGRGRSVLEVVEKLQGLVKTCNIHVSAPVVLRVMERYPLVLIRAWDGARLEGALGKSGSAQAVAEVKRVFDGTKRPHLEWMQAGHEGRLGGEFIREYYSLVAAMIGSGKVNKSLIEEGRMFEGRRNSVVITTPVVSAPTPPPRNPWAPPVETPKGLLGAGAGTKASKEALRQVAAASAALSAVHENPGVVAMISGGGGSYEEKLNAVAVIYQQILSGEVEASKTLFDARKLEQEEEDGKFYLQQEELAEQIAEYLTQDIENSSPVSANQ